MTTTHEFNSSGILPGNATEGTWIARVWVPAELAVNGVAGPRVVRVADGQLYDLSAVALSTSQLLNLEDPVAAVRAAEDAPSLARLDDVAKHSLFQNRAARLGENRHIVFLFLKYGN